MSVRSSCVFLVFLIFLAASTSLEEQQQQDELSNINTSLRFVRSADAANKMNLKKRKTKKGAKRKKMEKGRKTKNKKIKKNGKDKIEKNRKNKNKNNKNEKNKKNKIKKNKKIKNRKNRKNKKNEKDKNRSKSRKNEKRKKKKQKNKKKKANRNLMGDCLVSAIIAMKRWKDAVSNFDKQLIRANKKSELAEKKYVKKGLFASVALKLVDVGGGNKSALVCAGSTDSVGAKQLTNLTQTLEVCEDEISSSCGPENFPSLDQYEDFQECNNSVNAFKERIQSCFDQSKEATNSEEACKCWTSSSMTTLSESVSTCKVAAAPLNNKAAKECVAVFSNCRKYEDESVSSIQACSQSVSELAEKATLLSKNKDALTDVKAKIARATTSSRNAFRDPATNCQEFLVLVTWSKLLKILI